VNIETGCRSKQQYLSKADAKRVARLMTARHRDGFHLYECSNCGYFHVGHIVRDPAGDFAKHARRIRRMSVARPWTLDCRPDGGPMTSTDPRLIARFDAAMSNIYFTAKREVRYNATRFLEMVRELGGLEAAHRLLTGDRIHDGLAELIIAGRSDLTVEALVLRDEFQPLFSDGELATARARLGRDS
jgi:hypothetical protein